MVIVVLERATPSQRGVMSRLTIELKAGIFVGNFGRRVREKLWNRIVNEWKIDGLMIYTTNTEQGFYALSNGDTSRQIKSIEGILLTQYQIPESKQKQI